MKKRFIIIATAVLSIAAASTAFAAASGSPAEILAGLTGRTVESVVAQKTDEETTYGSIAADEGVLDQFKSGMLEMKKDRLNQKVEAGILTQDEADAIVERIEENQAACDGSGEQRMMNGSCGLGLGLGNGAGNGNGVCDGTGMGKGMGSGNGTCLRDGSCG